MIMTDGRGVGTYTAVVVSETATTRAPESALDAGQRHVLAGRGSSSSLAAAAASAAGRRWSGHASSTDTAAELAAADMQPRTAPGLDCRV